MADFINSNLEIIKRPSTVTMPSSTVQVNAYKKITFKVNAFEESLKGSLIYPPTFHITLDPQKSAALIEVGGTLSDPLAYGLIGAGDRFVRVVDNGYEYILKRSSSSVADLDDLNIVKSEFSDNFTNFTSPFIGVLSGTSSISGVYSKIGESNTNSGFKVVSSIAKSNTSSNSDVYSSIAKPIESLLQSMPAYVVLNGQGKMVSYSQMYADPGLIKKLLAKRPLRRGFFFMTKTDAQEFLDSIIYQLPREANAVGLSIHRITLDIVYKFLRGGDPNMIFQLIPDLEEVSESVKLRINEKFLFSEDQPSSLSMDPTSMGVPVYLVKHNDSDGRRKSVLFFNHRDALRFFTKSPRVVKQLEEDSRIDAKILITSLDNILECWEDSLFQELPTEVLTPIKPQDHMNPEKRGDSKVIFKKTMPNIDISTEALIAKQAYKKAGKINISSQKLVTCLNKTNYSQFSRFSGDKQIDDEIVGIIRLMRSEVLDIYSTLKNLTLDNKPNDSCDLWEPNLKHALYITEKMESCIIRIENCCDLKLRGIVPNSLLPTHSFVEIQTLVKDVKELGKLSQELSQKKVIVYPSKGSRLVLMITDARFKQKEIFASARQIGSSTNKLLNYLNQPRIRRLSANKAKGQKLMGDELELTGERILKLKSGMEKLSDSPENLLQNSLNSATIRVEKMEDLKTIISNNFYNGKFTRNLQFQTKTNAKALIKLNKEFLSEGILEDVMFRAVELKQKQSSSIKKIKRPDSSKYKAKFSMRTPEVFKNLSNSPGSMRSIMYSSFNNEDYHSIIGRVTDAKFGEVDITPRKVRLRKIRKVRVRKPGKRRVRKFIKFLTSKKVRTAIAGCFKASDWKGIPIGKAPVSKIRKAPEEIKPFLNSTPLKITRGIKVRWRILMFVWEYLTDGA